MLNAQNVAQMLQSTICSDLVGDAGMEQKNLQKGICTPVWESVKTLPPKYRRVLKLHKIRSSSFTVSPNGWTYARYYEYFNFE